MERHRWILKFKKASTNLKKWKNIILLCGRRSYCFMVPIAQIDTILGCTNMGLNLNMTLLIILFCCLGQIICWLDVLRTFPIHNTNKHKKKNLTQPENKNKQVSVTATMYFCFIFNKLYIHTLVNQQPMTIDYVYLAKTNFCNFSIPVVVKIDIVILLNSVIDMKEVARTVELRDKCVEEIKCVAVVWNAPVVLAEEKFSSDWSVLFA